jgi:hypothetical protein
MMGAAGEIAPLVVETEPVSGCTWPAPVVGSRDSPTLLTEVQVPRQRLAHDNRPVTESLKL